MGIIKLLGSKGYDVRGMVKNLTAGDGEGGGTDIFSMLASIGTTLQEYGTSIEEVMLMASDSGLELTDILEVYQYLTSDPVPAGTKMHRVASESTKAATEPILIDYYQQYLTNWLKEETKNKLNR